VNYEEAFDGNAPGIFLRMPCVQFRELPAHRRGTFVKPGEATVREEIDRPGQEMIPCMLYQEPTAEEVEESRHKTAEALEKHLIAGQVASKWRVSPKPTQDRHEVVECPVCKGKLHLSQSAYNGHVSGKCETANCVSWIE
jgi:uncharacterized protein YbaR (Trm112 family)